MTLEDDDVRDMGTPPNDDWYARMAEGLYHRFRDISMSLDRRDSFVWQLDDGPTANGEPRRSEE